MNYLITRLSTTGISLAAEAQHVFRNTTPEQNPDSLLSDGKNYTRLTTGHSRNTSLYGLNI